MEKRGKFIVFDLAKIKLAKLVIQQRLQENPVQELFHNRKFRHLRENSGALE